ncbi:MAG: nuclear transport factor 2 family protein [Rhodothermaceae bacterium]|nr:nuclear transport factor 2 family protein [Rhodothermaceae bacterium]
MRYFCRFKRLFLLSTMLTMAGLMAITGCSSEKADVTELPAEVLTVQAFMDAFNERSVSGMLRHVDDNLRWYRIKNDQMVLETYGRDDFRTSMRTYFDSLEEVRTDIESITWNGPFVSLRERVTWASRTGQQSQSALAVYELKNGKIVRAWYYNASD